MHRASRLVALGALTALVTLSGCGSDAAWRPLDTRWYANAPATQTLPFDPDDRDALDHYRINPGRSANLADFFVHVPYGLLFALAAFLAWHHHRRAVMEQSSNPTGPLHDGPFVACGTVEHDPTWNGPVVRLDLHQGGTEWCNKGVWHHQWRESSRALNRRPFVVLRDDGVRVQVEPDDKVIVRDETDIVRHTLNTRTRVASIEPGQRVHVSGVLAGASLAQASAGGAYRGGHGMPVLRAPSIGPMVISNEQPGAQSLSRMRFYRAWALGVAALFAFVTAAVMPTYQLLSLTGDVTWTTPTAVRNWREWHKPKNSAGYWVYRWSVRGAYDDRGAQRSVEDDCGEVYYRCVTAGQCARVPFVVSWVAPSWHQVGEGPQLTTGRAVILGLLWAALLIGYPISVLTSRPWYMKKRVIDRGNGRLDQSRP